MGFLSDAWLEVKARLTRSNNGAGMIDPNYGASMQMWTPGQPVWTDKNYLSFVKNGYRKNPTVYACINKTNSGFAGINWKLYVDRDCKKTIDSHALLDRWHKPNPSMPGTGSFNEQVSGYWHMSGNSYIWAYRLTPESPPLALWPLRPDRMKAVWNGRNVEEYIYGYESNNPTFYNTADMLHMKFPAFDDDVYGLSPIEIASYLSDQNNEAQGWNTALMQNSGRPASAFFAKSFLTPEQRNQVKEELRRKFQGKRNAGMPLVLEADMTWQNVSMSPLELDWLQSRQANKQEICGVFDIAPELIGDSAGKTFANVSEAREALYTENILPKLDRYADYLNGWLVPMYPDLVRSGAYFYYDKNDIEALQDLIQKQKKEIHDRARADWLAGGMTLAEYCEIIGAEPPKFGNVRSFPSSVVLISEDSLEEFSDQSAPPEPDPTLPPALPPGNPPTTKQIAPPKTQTKSKDNNGVYQPDDLDARLAQYYKDGVTHLRWLCDATPCDICLPNNGVMVETGDPFPSGHILPPGHPNCKCSVVAFSTPGMGMKTRSIGPDTMKLLAVKVTEIIESNKSHEDNRPIANTSRVLPLRSLQLQTKQSRDDRTGEIILEIGPDIDTTPRDDDGSVNTATHNRRASRDAYRQFLERYGN